MIALGLLAAGRLRAGAARFARDRRGFAAVEFALLLPVLMTMVFGGSELASMVQNQRKVMLYARTVADLTGRSNVGSMDVIFNAASVVLRPYDASLMATRVSSLMVYRSGADSYGLVCSSAASGSTYPRSKWEVAGTNGIPPVPEAFRFHGAHYILAEVRMPYRPVFGSAIYNAVFGAGGLAFSKQMPWADRTDKGVILPGGSACS